MLVTNGAHEVEIVETWNVGFRARQRKPNLGELRRDGIAVNTLWPRATIATAAIKNLLGGEQVMKMSRTPEIMAEVQGLVRGLPETREGVVWIDRMLSRRQLCTILAAATTMTRDEYVNFQRYEALDLRHHILEAPDAPAALLALVADEDQWADGDVFVGNDPYHGGGHLPDYNVFAPVFADDGNGNRRMVLIASIQCHHGDTGGVGMAGTIVVQ